MVEMVLQSQLGKIELLPALPDALPEGTVSGVCARGGFELAFTWKNSELQNVTVTSKNGKKCTLTYKDKIIEFDTESGAIYRFNGMLNAK